MCPKDEYQKIYEFDKFYVIEPSISFNKGENDYTKYSGKLKGKAVEDGFEYNSFNNEWYLTVDEIKNYIATLK